MCTNTQTQLLEQSIDFAGEKVEISTSSISTPDTKVLAFPHPRSISPEPYLLLPSPQGRLFDCFLLFFIQTVTFCNFELIILLYFTLLYFTLLSANVVTFVIYPHLLFHFLTFLLSAKAMLKSESDIFLFSAVLFLFIISLIGNTTSFILLKVNVSADTTLLLLTNLKARA